MASYGAKAAAAYPAERQSAQENTAKAELSRCEKKSSIPFKKPYILFTPALFRIRLICIDPGELHAREGPEETMSGVVGELFADVRPWQI